MNQSASSTSSAWMLSEYISESVMISYGFISLSCVVASGCPTENTQIITGTEAAGELNWSRAFELELPPPPNTKVTLPQLQSSALLMLQELSAKWQMAAGQRGYCKFRAGSLWKHSHCRSYWLTHDSLWGCRRCQGSPFFSLHCISATLSVPSCWEESSSLKLCCSVVKKPGGGNTCCLHKITTGLTYTAVEEAAFFLPVVTHILQILSLADTIRLDFMYPSHGENMTLN